MDNQIEMIKRHRDEVKAWVDRQKEERTSPLKEYKRRLGQLQAYNHVLQILGIEK